MRATIYLVFATLCYFAFFAVFLYFVGFLAGLPFMPGHIDKGPVASPGVAILIDLALVAMFGIQHSVMARKPFKQALTRVVPQPLERSVYVLASSLVLLAVMLLWHPLPGVVWQIEAQGLRMTVWGIFVFGISMVFLSTWLIDHFELFGLSQPWREMRRKPAQLPRFRTPLFYRFVRHPLYLGFLIALWAAPTMSAGHVLFAFGMTAYIFIGARLEERDLAGQFGETYRQYQREVGFLVPGAGRRG